MATVGAHLCATADHSPAYPYHKFKLNLLVFFFFSSLSMLFFTCLLVFIFFLLRLDVTPMMLYHFLFRTRTLLGPWTIPAHTPQRRMHQTTIITMTTNDRDNTTTIHHSPLHTHKHIHCLLATSLLFRPTKHPVINIILFSTWTWNFIFGFNTTQKYILNFARALRGPHTYTQMSFAAK